MADIPRAAGPAAGAVEQVIALAEERLILRKRQVEGDGIRVALRTETVEELLRETLRGHSVSVEHVAIGREVPAMPEIRREGDVLIVPVVEEILVVEKRLLLKEEIRLRFATIETAFESRASRRRQRALVQRWPAAGDAGPPPPAPPGAAPAQTFAAPPMAAAAHRNTAMTRTITAMFKDRLTADAAVEQLVQQLGIDPDAVSVHARGDSLSGTADPETAPLAAPGAAEADGSFWHSLKQLFMPEDDRQAYSEGIRRGGILVSAEVPDDAAEAAMTILEEHDALDMEEEEAAWRSSGWPGPA
uniref:YsnF/AvaK domain-containing protein n=1 Tax=Roseomonas sp. 18066 TaxID=2681412 RepID=UPI00190FB5E2